MSLLSWNPLTATGSGGGATQTLVLSNTTLSLVPNGGSVVLPTTTVSSIQALNVSTLIVQQEIFMPSQVNPNIQLISTGQIVAGLRLDTPLVTAFTGSFNTMGTTTANITNDATIGSAKIGTISTNSISTNSLTATNGNVSTIYNNLTKTKRVQFTNNPNSGLSYGAGFQANAGLNGSNTVMFGHNDQQSLNTQFEVDADLVQYPNSIAVFPNLTSDNLHISSFIQMSNGSNIAVTGATLTYGGQNITTGNQGNAANWAQYPANAGYINFNNGSLNNINGISAQAGNIDLLTNYQQSQTNVNIGRYDVTLFPPTYQPNVNVGANNISLQAGVSLGPDSTAGYFTGNSINNDVYPGVASVLYLNNVDSHYRIVAHGGFDIPAVPNPLWPTIPPQYLSPGVAGGRGIIELTAYNSYIAGVVPNPLNPGLIKLNASYVYIGNDNTLPFGTSQEVDIQASLVNIIAGTYSLPNLFGITGLNVRSRNGVTIRNLDYTSNYDSKLFVRELWGQSILPLDGGIITDRNLYIQAQGNPGVTMSNVKTIYGQDQWGFNGVDIINLNTATGNYPNAITSNLSSLQGQINALNISTTGGVSSPALWYKFPALSTVTLNQGLAFNNFASPSLAPIQSYNGAIFTDFNNQLNTLGIGSLALGLTGGNSLSTLITPLSQGGIGIYKINNNTVLGDIAVQNVLFNNIYPLYVSTGQLYFNGSTLQSSNVSPTIISSVLTFSSLTVSSIYGNPDLSFTTTSTLKLAGSNLNLAANAIATNASTIITTTDQFNAQTTGNQSQFYLDKTQAYVGGPLIGINAVSTLSIAAGTSQINVNPDNITVAAQKTLNIATTSTINLTASQSTGGGSPTTLNYTSPGTYSWTAPAGVTSIDLNMTGAGGGGGDYTSGGKGGYISGTLAVVPGVSYTIVVGGGGGGANSYSPGAGGYGGGGSGGSGYYQGGSSGAGGGGASYIQNGGTLLAAVGGGGGTCMGNSSSAGAGGGSTGGNGANAGYGGSQSAGGTGFTGYGDGNGSYLQGGNGNYYYQGAGGGGGYYGGGGGVGGGGGSDYIDLLTGTVTQSPGGGANGGGANSAGANGTVYLSYTTPPSLTGAINLISPSINLTGGLTINGVPYALPSSIYISTSYAVPANITVSSITMQSAAGSPQGTINFPKAISGLASLQVQGNATNANGFLSVLDENLNFNTFQASETVLLGNQSQSASGGFASILGGNNYLKIRTIDSAGIPTNFVEGANYKFALNNISSVNGVPYIPYTGGGGGGGGGGGTNNFSTLIASDFWISTPGANTMRMEMGLPPFGGSGYLPNCLTMTNQSAGNSLNTADLAVGSLYITPYVGVANATPFVIQRGGADLNMFSRNYNGTSLPGTLYTNFNNIVMNTGTSVVSINPSTINFPNANLNISSINGLAPGSGSGSVSNWAQYPVIGGSQYIDFGAQSIWLKGVGNAVLTNQLGTSNLPLTAKYFTAFDPGGVPGLGIFGLDGEGVPAILGGYSLPTQLHVSTLQISGSNVISANPSTILVNGFDPVSNWYNYNTAYSTLNIAIANDGVNPFSNGGSFPAAGSPITIDNINGLATTNMNISDSTGRSYPNPTPFPGPYGSYTFTIQSIPNGGTLYIASYTSQGPSYFSMINSSGTITNLAYSGYTNQILVGGPSFQSGTAFILDTRGTTYPKSISIKNDTTQGADLIIASNATKGLQTMRIWENAAGVLNIDNGGSGLSINGNTTTIPNIVATNLNVTTIAATVTSNVSTVASNVIFMDSAGLANNNVLTGNASGLFYKGSQLASATNVQTWSLYKAQYPVDLNNNKLIGTFSTVGAATSNYAIDLSNFVNYTTTPAGATTFGIRIASSNLVSCNHFAPQISLFTDSINGGGGITSYDTYGGISQPFTFNVNTLTTNATTLTASNVTSGNIAATLFTPSNITPPVLNTLRANVDTMYISTLQLANYTNPNSGSVITGSVNISPLIQSGISTLGVKAFGSPNYYTPIALDKGYTAFGTVSYTYTGGANPWVELFPSVSVTPQSRFGVLTGTWSYSGTPGSPNTYNDMQIGVGVFGDSTETNIFRQFWYGAISGINRSPYSISLVIDFTTILTNQVTIKMKPYATLAYTFTNLTIRWLGPGSF